MLDVFHVILYLHVMGVVVALGPTYVFPVLGGLSAREPQHGNFALRLSLAVQDRLIIPIAGSLAITGVGLIATADPAISITEPWLLASIILYSGALTLSIGVMRPAVIRLVALTAQPPTAPGASGSGRPAGPPPAVRSLLRRQRLTGTALTVLILVIVLLMVVQPGGAGA